MVADALGYMSERTIRLLLTAIVGILVARYLGPRDFGLLSYAGSVFGLLAPLTMLGMQSVLVREFSTREDWRRVLTSAAVIQTPAAIIAAIIGVVVLLVTREFEREAVLLAAVMAPLPLLGLAGPALAYLEAAGRVRRIVVAGLVAGVTGSSLKLTGLLLQVPVWVLGAFGTIEAIILFLGLLGGIPSRKRLSSLTSHFDTETARRLLRESWPLLLSGIAVTIYMKADILMLGLLAGDLDTGLYTAAARLSEVWYFIPMSALAAFRPQLSRMFAAGQSSRYRVATQKFMTVAVGVSLIVLALVLLAANQIIGFLYGVEFSEASPVLRIHILSAPFVFLGVAASPWFIDHGMTRAVMVRSTLGAALNVILNFALIPRYGALGASVATLVAYASGVLINVFPAATRTLFWMQMKALRLYWPRTNHVP